MLTEGGSFVINSVPQQLGLFIGPGRREELARKKFEKKMLTGEGRLGILPILLQRKTQEAQQEVWSLKTE